MVKLNKFIVEASETVGSMYPNDRTFVEELHKFQYLLENLPNEFECQFHRDVKPEKLGDDPLEVLVNLVKNMYGWMGYFLYTNAYKLRQIIKNLIDSLNTGEYIPVMMMARSLMEYAATINYYGEQFSPKLARLDKLRENELSKESSAEIVQLLVQIIQICHKYSRLTRFNWRAYMTGDFENFFAEWNIVDPEDKQLNVLTLIDKLPQEEKGARFFYEMLSDYVHPNLASHILVIDQTNSVGKDKVRYMLSKNPQDVKSLAFIVIHTIALPVKLSLQRMKYWIDFFKHTIDVTKRWVEVGEGLL